MDDDDNDDGDSTTIWFAGTAGGATVNPLVLHANVTAMYIEVGLGNIMVYVEF